MLKIRPVKRALGIPDTPPPSDAAHGYPQTPGAMLEASGALLPRRPASTSYKKKLGGAKAS